MKAVICPHHRRSGLAAWFVLALLIATGCASVATLDPIALDTAKTLKQSSLGLMDLAVQPFPDQAARVRAHKDSVLQACRYESERKNNESTVALWRIIVDPDEGSLFGFLQRWEADTTLSEAYVTEMKSLIGAQYDEIILLEQKKRQE